MTISWSMTKQVCKTPNSEESLRRNQTCIISSASGYANQNAEAIVYSSQYLFSLKSCASVLSWDVKNRLSDLGIEWRKRGVRAGKQIKERHYNLRPISSRITSRSIEDDNKRLTHRYVDRSLLLKIPHQKIYRIPVILDANLRSLSNKVDELHYIAECNNADAVCISESWLSPQIPDPAVAIPGYNLFRNDCTPAPGGGSVFIWEKPYRSMHSIISM